MFLRSKIQEVILRRRSRSMNSAGAQRSHVPDQAASSSTVPCDGDSGGAGADAAGSKSAAARALFASPRLLHSSSLPAGTVTFAKSPARDAESERAISMSPTSVLEAAAAFAPGPDGAGKRRRPWRARDNNGLADALDCGDQQQQERVVLAATSSSSSLLRSCSLDRRVEFGVKNKSSWLPLRASSGREATSPAPADPIEPSPESEDYTCVISRGPNPRTVHIFGDRVVEGGAGAGAGAAAEREETSPRPINLPGRSDRGFFSL